MTADCKTPEQIAEWRPTWKAAGLMLRCRAGYFIAFLVVLSASASSCSPLTDKAKTETRADEDLRLTLGGFREGHPDEGEVNGVCGTDATRNVLDCDIYNGLQGWTISELTFVITWSPYKENDKRYFAERVSIEPLKTERVSIRLGLQLPADTQLVVRGRSLGKPLSHWGWSIVAAKGHPNK